MSLRIYSLVILTLINLSIYKSFSQTATTPLAGDGTSENPYEIANLENLFWIKENPDSWTKYFIQTANINAAETQNWFEGRGWQTIGNSTVKFTGSYNGQGYTIDSLFINNPDTNHISLFGYINNAVIKYLGVTNVNITGKEYVGGIIGYSNFSTVAYCYTTGIVSGYRIIGGFTGTNNNGYFLNNFSRSNVNCINNFAGGFMGEHYLGNTIHCYSTGIVKISNILQTNKGFSGSTSTWGDYNDTKNFWDAETSGATLSLGKATGKLTAEMKTQSTFEGWDFDNVWHLDNGINDGYPHLKMNIIPEVSTKALSNVSVDSALSGGTVTKYFNDSVITRGVVWKANAYPTIANNDGLTNDGLGSGEFNSKLEFTSLTAGALYHVRAYATNSNGTSYGLTLFFTTHPFMLNEPTGDGSESNPYQISSLADLYWISQTPNHWDKHYIQTATINAAPTANWFKGGGFPTIDANLNSGFTGQYDGKGFTIDSLHINNTNYNTTTALFGYTQNATIKNIGLTNINIKGQNNAAALVGYCSGSTIKNCYSTGLIEGTNNTGGLIGRTYNSTISSCYSTCDVSAEQYTGGFIGYNHISTIENCFSRGKVTRKNGSSDIRIGSFAGYSNQSTSIIRFSYSTGAVIYEDTSNPTTKGFVGDNYQTTFENNFFDRETSLQTSATGATSKTTADMKLQNTFTNWQFSTIWNIDNAINSGYPYLLMLEVPDLSTLEIKHITTSTAQSGGNIKTDNGFTITSSGIVWSKISYPTIDNNDGKTIEDSTGGIYNSNISELIPNTTYYVRAYATNEKGTAYGNQITFITHTINPVQPIGEGTTSNPYQIANLANLVWLKNNEEHWNKHYIQTANINASSTANWFKGDGWQPIGTEWSRSFKGTYNGQKYSIDSIHINAPNTNNIGFFGFLDSAYVSNLRLNNIKVEGKDYVGGLVGYATNTQIERISCSGDIKGVNYIGGLVGFSVSISVEFCYTTGKTTGNSRIGGLIGYINDAFARNCYSRSEAITSNNTVSTIAGLIGENYYATISNCYSTGSVSRLYTTNPTDKGLIGTNTGGVFNNNYFDKITSLQETSAGTSATAKTTAEMKTISTFTNWDFDTIWNINADINNGYPYLKALIPPASIGGSIIENKTDHFSLTNYPNPFTTSTEINFTLDKYSFITLSIYNQNGELVKTLVNNYLQAEKHTFTFNAEGLSNNIYLYRLTDNKNSTTKKMILIK
jgi:hypothetical protein